jgi:hypothetical protein
MMSPDADYGQMLALQNETTPRFHIIAGDDIARSMNEIQE